MKQINQAFVPQWPELKLNEMMNQVKADQQVMSYLPDPDEKKIIDRQFFWSILSTLRPDFVGKLVNDAAD